MKIMLMPFLVDILLSRLVSNMPKSFAKKVKLDGYTFDSMKEAKFYEDYIRDSGYSFTVHEKFQLIDKYKIGNYNMRGVTYSPDFVIRNQCGEIIHVYDVKTGYTSYAITTGVSLRFKMFTLKYGVPVEVVVVRTHDFKTKIVGLTKKTDPQVRNNVSYRWDSGY